MKSKIRELITFTSDFQHNEDIILRDYLAMERTKLANERTLLSYVRTSLYLLLGGLALLGLEDFRDLTFIGYLSLGISGLLIVIGIVRYSQLQKQLKKFYISIENLNSKKPTVQP